MKIVNLSTVVQTVAIVLADGRKTTVRIMPKARPDLPEGAKVDPNWMVRFPGAIKELETAKPLISADLEPESSDEADDE